MSGIPTPPQRRGTGRQKAVITVSAIVVAAALAFFGHDLWRNWWTMASAERVLRSDAPFERKTEALQWMWTHGEAGPVPTAAVAQELDRFMDGKLASRQDYRGGEFGYVLNSVMALEHHSADTAELRPLEKVAGFEPADSTDVGAKLIAAEATKAQLEIMKRVAERLQRPNAH